jgi:hypothetical protein
VNGAYYFSINVSNSILNPFRGITINSNHLEIQEQTYELIDGNIDGNFGASYQIYPSDVPDEYITNSIVKGEITFTRFDLVNQIVSGTFWFDAVNKDGVMVEVREGRFDVHFIK